MEFYVINNLKSIQKERERIEKALAEHPEKGEVGGMWHHLSKWLKVTNQDHFNHGDDSISCNVCGALEVEMIHANFSFCDEYDCGITFCRKCARQIGKL
jgi:hypothetical protein